MKIWAVNALGQGVNACAYYRIEVPLDQLQKLGYARTVQEPALHKGALPALIQSDIGHFYGVNDETYLHQLKTFRKLPSSVRDGEDIYPPSLIYDFDDNQDFIHPFNLGPFAWSGVRDSSGRLLKPGDCLEILDARGRPVTDSRGEPVAWIDKETTNGPMTFDIARNLHLMKVRHEIIRTVHGVTVPSETLARYMREVIGAKNVYVFPNTIVPGDYEQIRAVRTDPPGTIRILWQGGMSHWGDWYPLRDALKTISQKYPQVKFVIFGEWFHWVHEAIPDSMVEYHKWVGHEAYKLKRHMLNIDINLAPLTNNLFNACKSACKWYEASFTEAPEATLAGRTPTYSEITDGETGLLYTTPEEFVQKLSALIEDAALRNRLATGARQWVLENRTPKATIPGLNDFYMEVRARHRRELGKPIIQRATLDEIKKVGVALR